MSDAFADAVRWLAVLLGAMVAAVLGFYDNLGNLLPWLGIAIFIDVLSGFAAAAIGGGIDSRIARIGIIRKMYTLLIVIASEIIEVVYIELVGPVPFNFSNFAAGFFILVEVVSILENAGRAGVPWPPWLKGVLAVLNGKVGGEAPPPAPVAVTTTTTTTATRMEAAPPPEQERQP
jgi:toxin secretion/phage lysis holin